MNLTVNSQRLATELRLLNKVVPVKPAIAILSHALLIADERGLHLYATDLEVGLSTDCEARVTMSGQVALPVARLLQLVEQFQDADIELTAEKKQVSMRCGMFRSRLQSMPALDFPRAPEPDGTPVTVSGVALRSMIERTRYAVSPTAQKYVLQGALLALSGQVAAMVATDSKRLSIATTSREAGQDLRVVIPMKALDALSANLTDQDVEVVAGQRNLFFTLGGRLLTSRTLESPFPAYERIIPQGNDVVVEVERHALTSALRRVVLVAEENRAVYVSLTSGQAELAAQSAEVGAAAEVVSARYEGDALKVCINGRYMLDFLEVAVQPTVAILLKDAKAAVLLKDGDDHVGVIMLMRS